MDKTPLLSLCIPTSNRGNILKKTLSELLSYDSVDSEVQIVVGDNASTDITFKVVQDIKERFPNKNIKYFKNNCNIGIKNFYEVLYHADGIYCKLINDYTCMSDETIEFIKSKVKKYNIKSNETIHLNFTYNFRGKVDESKEIGIGSLRDYVLELNNKMTWVSNFGCYKNRLKELQQYEKFDDKLLSIQYWTLHLAKYSDKIIICPISNANCLFVPNSNRVLTYNFFTPHVVMYYEIIANFIKLSPKDLRIDKKRLLTDFVGAKIYEYLILKKECPFDTEGSWKILWKHFRDVPYFYYFIPLKFAKSCFGKIKRLFTY